MREMEIPHLANKVQGWAQLQASEAKQLAQRHAPTTAVGFMAWVTFGCCALTAGAAVLSTAAFVLCGVLTGLLMALSAGSVMLGFMLGGIACFTGFLSLCSACMLTSAWMTSLCINICLRCLNYISPDLHAWLVQRFRALHLPGLIQGFMQDRVLQRLPNTPATSPAASTTKAVPAPPAPHASPSSTRTPTRAPLFDHGHPPSHHQHQHHQQQHSKAVQQKALRINTKPLPKSASSSCSSLNEVCLTHTQGAAPALVTSSGLHEVDDASFGVQDQHVVTAHPDDVFPHNTAFDQLLGPCPAQDNPHTLHLHQVLQQTDEGGTVLPEVSSAAASPVNKPMKVLGGSVLAAHAVEPAVA